MRPLLQRCEHCFEHAVHVLENLGIGEPNDAIYLRNQKICPSSIMRDLALRACVAPSTSTISSSSQQAKSAK
jgi:hypothetical protein